MASSMRDFESNANPPEANCVGVAQPRAPPLQCNHAVQYFAEIPQLVQKLKLHNPTHSRLASRAKCYDAECSHEVSKASNVTVQTRIVWLSAWLCRLFSECMRERSRPHQSLRGRFLSNSCLHPSPPTSMLKEPLLLTRLAVGSSPFELQH